MVGGGRSYSSAEKQSAYSIAPSQINNTKGEEKRVTKNARKPLTLYMKIKLTI